MSKADIMKKWDSLSSDIAELVSLSEIITYVLFNGEDDNTVKRHIAGVASLLTNNLNNFDDRFTALLCEMQEVKGD